MKQILQNLKNGATEVADVPCPRAGRASCSSARTRTLVSAGTERMLVDFGKAGLIDKARQQPDKVRMVLDKIRTDGLVPTLEAVRNKLDQPLPLGYCNVGRGGRGRAPASPASTSATAWPRNGKHAEVVGVPVNLCARMPDGVTTMKPPPSPCSVRSRCRASAWCSRRWAKRWSSPAWG